VPYVTPPGVGVLQNGTSVVSCFGALAPKLFRGAAIGERAEGAHNLCKGATYGTTITG
jgi:hypothetical protein